MWRTLGGSSKNNLFVPEIGSYKSLSISWPCFSLMTHPFQDLFNHISKYPPCSTLSFSPFLPHSLFLLHMTHECIHVNKSSCQRVGQRDRDRTFFVLCKIPGLRCLILLTVWAYFPMKLKLHSLIQCSLFHWRIPLASPVSLHPGANSSKATTSSLSFSHVCPWW